MLPAVKITRPIRYMTDPKYPDECKLALEASFEALMTKAVAAGWEPRQVAYSLMILAAEKLQGFPRLEDAVMPDG
jgi:hypothetical protein